MGELRDLALQAVGLARSLDRVDREREFNNAVMAAVGERLAAAERVCALYGSVPLPLVLPDALTVRGRALLEAWMEWHDRYGATAPGVTDDEVERLAATRDRRRADALSTLMSNPGRPPRS